MTKRVRLVVLNYNGGDDTLRAVDALHHLDWPADQLEIVVVDNASSDDSVERITRSYPGVRTIRLPTNDGFPANNLAMRDLGDVRYVGLVNNDAFADPAFLTPLVDALDADPGLGAASPLMVFERQFVDVELSTAAVRVGRGDPRALGVRISGLRVDGVDVWRNAQVSEGGHGTETSSRERYEWTSDRAVLRVPVVRNADLPSSVEVLLSTVGTKQVTARSGPTETQLVVTGDPAWLTVGLAGEPYDVVNNAGSIVFDTGHGADRGYGQARSAWEAARTRRGDLTGAPADAPADGDDLFAWCGGAVLLRPEYLTDVGLFDERFFLYYEDTDLSWRGQARGWRYRFVPESVVRHLHASTSVEGSDRFSYFTERNRLAMLVKNAPLPMVTAALRSYVRQTYDALRRDVLTAVLRRRCPNTVPVRRRVRAFVGFVWLAPRLVPSRVRIRRRQQVTDADLLRRLEPTER